MFDKVPTHVLSDYAEANLPGSVFLRSPPGMPPVPISTTRPAACALPAWNRPPLFV